METVFESLSPSPKADGGRPRTAPRRVVNSLLYILLTGCRWCDLSKGPPWSSKSSAHRWLQRWYEDGTMEQLQSRILGMAQNRGLIGWDCSAIDASFSPSKGGGTIVTWL